MCAQIAQKGARHVLVHPPAKAAKTLTICKMESIAKTIVIRLAKLILMTLKTSVCLVWKDVLHVTAPLTEIVLPVKMWERPHIIELLLKIDVWLQAYLQKVFMIY